MHVCLAWIPMARVCQQYRQASNSKMKRQGCFRLQIYLTSSTSFIKAGTTTPSTHLASAPDCVNAAERAQWVWQVSRTPRPRSAPHRSARTKPFPQGAHCFSPELTLICRSPGHCGLDVTMAAGERVHWLKGLPVMLLWVIERLRAAWGVGGSSLSLWA